MAGGGGSLGGVGKAKRGKSKRKKKARMGFHIDMTPLVDITFLLLTFFMFTTSLIQPQVMDMKLPPEIDVQVKVKESWLFTLLIDANNRLLWYTANDELNEVKISGLKKLLVDQNLKESAKNELISSLKVDDKADYGLAVEVLDIFNQAEVQIERGLVSDASGGERVKRKRKFAISRLLQIDQDKIDEEMPADEVGSEELEAETSEQ